MRPCSIAAGFAGVQCENCHGSGLEHASNPGDESLRPTVNLASTVCGQCHTGAHHPTFDEWQLPKHATALAGLRTSSHAGDSCLECHSQDYRHAIEEGETPPTIDTAVLSLECSTCHSPHGGVAQEHQHYQEWEFSPAAVSARGILKSGGAPPFAPGLTGKSWAPRSPGRPLPRASF